MGSFLFSSPSNYLQLARYVSFNYIRQQGADVRDFACSLLIKVNHMSYTEEDIKEVLNICFDMPLSPGEMEKLGEFGILALCPPYLPSSISSIPAH